MLLSLTTLSLCELKQLNNFFNGRFACGPTCTETHGRVIIVNFSPAAYCNFFFELG